MKFSSTSVLLLVLSLALTCSAICDCDAQDQECVQKCVIEANSCIASSKGETSYEDCIDDKWPSGEMFHKQDVPARPSNTDGKNEPSESGSTIASGTSNPAKATHSQSSSGMKSNSGSKASETGINANNNNKNNLGSNSGATSHLLALNEMMTVIGLMMVALVGTWVHG